MHNGGRIVIGLIIFIALITFPVWYNVAKGKAGYVPELEKAARGEECVRDTTYMIAYHMDLLNEWRDEVVRFGDRFYVDSHGHRVEKSLSNTCLSCHENKDKFCDRCHDYMGVDPYCWDCHVIPKEVSGASR
jgi:hypothetical protein